MPLTSKEKGIAIAVLIGFGVISISLFFGLSMMSKESSKKETREEVVDKPKVEEVEEVEEVEPEEKLSENGNPFCQGYLVTHCNLNKYPPNPQHSMDNPNISKCDQRFISVANTESSTGYLQCMLSKDGNACNMWNEVDKSDKIKCDLEVEGLPYCESDILYGPGLNAVSGTNVLGKSTTQKAIYKANLIAKIKDNQSKCKCEDGKSVKGETIKLFTGQTTPSYQWYCG